MKAAIITAAGVSSRFNEGVAEKEKCLKCIYYEEDKKDTLLYHLIRKCGFADKIVLVGGYQYDELNAYCEELPGSIRDKIVLIKNEHYEDLASGYSFHIGLNKLFACFAKSDNVEEVLLVEGDLDIDKDSFSRVIASKHNVLTYNFAPIYANKAVVLYQNKNNCFQYAFSSSHGLLKIDEAFSLILNSGQIWKFTEIEKLKVANEMFSQTKKDGTNLEIIQSYIDSCSLESFELIGLLRWTNCNTREDYKTLLADWKKDAK